MLFIGSNGNERRQKEEKVNEDVKDEILKSQ